MGIVIPVLNNKTPVTPQEEEELPPAFEESLAHEDSQNYIEILEFNGVEYVVCGEGETAILQECGISSELTQDLAGEHVCYLGFEKSASSYRYFPVEKAGPEEENDIELFEYVPGPNENVYILCKAGGYYAAVRKDMLHGNYSSAGREGIVPDGVLLEGGDPAMYRVAVIPAEASLQDVADATAVSVDEEDAKNIERLGAYLPDTLPEGYRYGPAGYFETTMKDGTQYHLIRVTYESGSQAVSAPGPENAQVWMGGSTAFIWTVRDHCPGNDKPIYQLDEVTLQFLDQRHGSVFFIDYDGVYVGIERLEISTEEMMSIIDSIG